MTFCAKIIPCYSDSFPDELDGMFVSCAAELDRKFVSSSGELDRKFVSFAGKLD